MATTTDDTPQQTKTHQASIRITAEQHRLLKQHCVRNNLTTQEVLMRALQGIIPGF